MNPLWLIVFLAIVVSFIGMVKWTSTLFSGGSGKLGNQVVFAKWKGRNYMRAYVIPANPQTNPQTAQRLKNAAMVTGYQTEVAPVPLGVTQWNELALPRQISGFNLFGKYALQISLAGPPGGGAPYDATMTYTVPTDLSAMGMYRSFNDAAVTEVVAKGALLAGDDQTFDDNALAAGNYKYFIGPADVFADQVGAAKDAVKCAHWSTTPSAGTIANCEFTVA